jgi:CheY-like chemotaxis protein
MPDPVDEAFRQGTPHPAETPGPPHAGSSCQPGNESLFPSPQQRPEAHAGTIGPRVVPVLALTAGRERLPGQAGFGFAAAGVPHLAPPCAGAGSAPITTRSDRLAGDDPLPSVTAATILIVENEESNRTLMEKILGFAGYHCITACNGQEALDAFDRRRPDLVLTDIAMPVMDGYETAAHIRARPEGVAIPIVAVTAHAMSGDREYALQRGCNAYLAKPYRPRELLEVVERLLKEASK